MADEDGSNEDAARSRQTIVGAIVVVVLIAAGWWLMSTLQYHRDVGDCIASGRHDCVPVTPDK